jgi:hypothetical protein
MKTRLTLKPGQPGTKREVHKYGGLLVAVRFRYDAGRRLHFKTVELIEEQRPWVPTLASTDSPIGAKRPSSVQAWVTESKAYLIKTEEMTPTVSEVAYPAAEPERFASQLVAEHAGFRKGNSTMTISAGDVRALKGGRASHQGSHLNGTLRITSEGVVFFLPNEFET